MATPIGSPKKSQPTPGKGPTIYKCDQLRAMLEEALRNRSALGPETDVRKFLEQHLRVRNETVGKSKSESYVQGTRFPAFCKQLSEALGLNRDFVQQRILYLFVHDVAQLKELCDQLAVVREHYDAAVSLLKDESLQRPVTIRIGTTNLINMRVLPSVLDEVRHQFQAQFPEIQLKFVQTIQDSDELLFGSQSHASLDVIVACCLEGSVSKLVPEELVAQLPLQCCLLRQRPLAGNHPSRESSLRPSLSAWEAIRDTPMVALTSRLKHFAVPWSQIEGLVESFDEVPTLLEAHARVAASDSWTLSYRELLDDADERNLEALDLPADLSRDTTLIVAVTPRTKKRRRSSSVTKQIETASDVKPVITLSADSKEKQAALALLKTCLRKAFEERATRRREAVELTRCLARFTHTYHVSELVAPTTNNLPERHWFCGRLQLECTANGNLSGSVTVGTPTGELMRMRVFGRPLKLHDGKVWNLNWRSTDPQAESGTTNLFVTKSDLEKGEALVGHWVGRSSWSARDVRPTGGPVILHSRSDLTARELRALVTKHKDAAIPNLQLVANHIVPYPRDNTAALPAPPRVSKPRATPARSTASRATAASISDALPRKVIRPR